MVIRFLWHDVSHWITATSYDKENSCTVKWILNIMLRKLIVRNLNLYYVCCYIYICTVLFVYAIILCVMALLQIKFCIWVFKGGSLSHLSPLTSEVVGAPQMTLQQYISTLLCLPLPPGNLQPHSRPFLDVIIPSFLLSSSDSCSLHCLRQKWLRHARGSWDVAIPS